MLKVAAIGTVADVVDLSTPENRAIVAHGIQGLRAGRYAPGLHALLEVAGVQGEITSEDLGFRLGPRINAAGRLAKATSVIELFDERDPGRARAKAQELDSLNGKRQQIQRKLVSTVLETLGEASHLLCNGGPSKRAGTVGSWASSPPRSATRPIDRQPSSPSQVTTPEAAFVRFPERMLCRRWTQCLICSPHMAGILPPQASACPPTSSKNSGKDCATGLQLKTRWVRKRRRSRSTFAAKQMRSAYQTSTSSPRDWQTWDRTEGQPGTAHPSGRRPCGRHSTDGREAHPDARDGHRCCLVEWSAAHSCVVVRTSLAGREPRVQSLAGSSDRPVHG